MKNNDYIIFTDYPINRLQDSFGKEGPLDNFSQLEEEDPGVPFINIIPEVLWINQDGIESTVLVYSNTSWSIVEDDKNLTIKTEKDYGKTSMANGDSWIWKW